MSVTLVLLLIVVSLVLYIAVRVGAASDGGTPLVSVNRLLLLLALGLLIVITARVYSLQAVRSSASAPVAAPTATPLSAPPAAPSTPAASSPASVPSPSSSSPPATSGPIVPSQTPTSTDLPTDTSSSPTDTPSTTPESSATSEPSGSASPGATAAGCRCPPATATEAAAQFGGSSVNWFCQDLRGDSWTYRSFGWVPLRFSVPDRSVVDMQQGRVFPNGVVTAADFTISWSADDSGR